MGQNFEIIISGDSMHPFLRNGERIKVKHIAPDKVEVGDIIVY